MKVFVTGATGFIGRALVQRLIEQGNEVVSLVRQANHNLPKGVHAVYGDILSPASLGDSGCGCQRLYHLAAMVSFSPAKRRQLLLVNGGGTSNILAVSRRWKIEATVVVSSACTMGLSSQKDKLLDEESPLDDRIIKTNPYLESKLASERAAVAVSENIKVVIVNPTTVYGPGDWALNSGSLVQKIATASVLPVPPGGGNVVDVDDVVEGIILAGERGVSGSRYIIGGQNLPFREIFRLIAEVIGKRQLFMVVPGALRRPLSFTAGLIGKFTDSRFITTQIINDMFLFKYYSGKRAENELGFKPRYDFRETIKKAWLFYKANGLIERV